MQPVDRCEFLRQRVGGGVVVRQSLRDTLERMRVEEPDAELAEPILRSTIPVGSQTNLNRLRGENRWRPFNRVDFGDEGGDNQSSSLIDTFVVPCGICELQLVADDIVLTGEKRVHRAEPE